MKTKLFTPSTFKGKRILITGHTGFKGSWLTRWLHLMGAEVAGLSNGKPFEPCHLDLCFPDFKNDFQIDVRDFSKTQAAIHEFQPQIVFHMAAQPLVRYSYQNPIETYETNVMGTLHVLEACRKTPSVQSILVVTSDKCYENREQVWPYREGDAMGGYDPYSSSKGCAELLVSSYRRSYFPVEKFGTDHNVLLASARGGNVIGGGDWSEDRLIPDIIRAAKNNSTLTIRSPKATRPWQHVLDCLSGYLQIVESLEKREVSTSDGWNIGPNQDSFVFVENVVRHFEEVFSDLTVNYENLSKLHEANFLALDCSKAYYKLGWQSCFDFEKSIEETSDWYRCFLNGSCETDAQINRFMNNL